MENVEIKRKDNFLSTFGLKDSAGYELQTLIKDKSMSDYFEVMNYLTVFITESKRKILNDETIAYKSWLFKFVETKNSLYSIHEVKRDGTGFTEGVDNAIEITDSQSRECSKESVFPVFPTFSQKIAISEGVYEGEAIDAVRYPSPSHMTGWWLTTNLYDGNIKSLKVVHYFHVAFQRPEILKYLALPYGYRFNFDKKQDIEDTWFDKSVLES
jgi:hypothetical protein